MLVNHAHRYYFVHGRKTAGSSLKVSLARYLTRCDDWLVGATQDCYSNHILPASHRAIGVQGWVNYWMYQACVISSMPRVAGWAANRNNKIMKKKTRFATGHEGVDAMAELLGTSFDKYTGLSIVRDPCDRLWSFYKWRSKWTSSSIDVERFVRTAIGLEVKPYHMAELFDEEDFLFKGGQLRNRLIVLRYENLSTEVNKVKAVQPGYDSWLPNAKVGEKREPPFTPSIRRQIYNRFKLTANAFNYG